MNPQMGPRYILKDAYQIKMRDLKYQRHKKRLDDIKTNDYTSEYKSDENCEHIQKLKMNNLRFQNNEKLNQIDRENQILLERLVLISKTANPELTTSKSEPKHLNVLHLDYRKKEQERISQENAIFARRLMSQRPLFDRKKLDKEFEKHNKLIKQMQKLDLYSPRFPLKLPPLQDKPKDFDTSMSIDNKFSKHYDSVILSPRGLVLPQNNPKIGAKAQSPNNKVISPRDNPLISETKTTEVEKVPPILSSENKTANVEDQSSQGKIDQAKVQNDSNVTAAQEKPKENISEPKEKPVEQDKTQQIEEDIPTDENTDHKN